MKENKEIIISFLSITKMGKQRIVTIPRSIDRLQPGDLVMIVKFSPELLNLPDKVKSEWVDYRARRRFN
mgnify:CR=1 FL=1